MVDVRVADNADDLDVLAPRIEADAHALTERRGAFEEPLREGLADDGDSTRARVIAPAEVSPFSHRHAEHVEQLRGDGHERRANAFRICRTFGMRDQLSTTDSSSGWLEVRDCRALHAWDLLEAGDESAEVAVVVDVLIPARPRVGVRHDHVADVHPGRDRADLL